MAEYGPLLLPMSVIRLNMSATACVEALIFFGARMPLLATWTGG
jgi:hypothetical protein